MKTIIIVLVTVYFITGCSSVNVYKHTTLGWKGNIAFHDDWPTYGLPLVEYSVLMKLIQNGETEKAKRRLDIFLDATIDDALSRKKIANAEQKEKINQALLWVAKMRQKYPRIYSDDRPKFKERSIRIDKALEKILNHNKIGALNRLSADAPSR